MTEPWLTARRGEAPLIVSFPHSGLELPSDCTAGLISADLARHDADWYVDRLHVFAHDFGATTQSLVMRSRSGTVRFVSARHPLDKLREFSQIEFG